MQRATFGAGPFTDRKRQGVNFHLAFVTDLARGKESVRHQQQTAEAGELVRELTAEFEEAHVPDDAPNARSPSCRGR